MVDQYSAVIEVALALGGELVQLIKDHAKANLTPEEYQQLESRWNADVIRAAADAGITPAPDVPLS